MVRLETVNRSIRVTEDHRMLVRKTSGSGDFKIVHAKDMVNREGQLPICGHSEPFEFEVDQPYDPTTKAIQNRITQTAYDLRKRSGYSHQDSLEEARRRIDRRCDYLRRKKPSELTIAECEMIGFWVGDGNKTQLSRGGVEYIITQSKVYSGIIEWFDSVIVATGYHVARRKKTCRTNKGECDMVTWSFARGTGGGCQEVDGIFPIEHFLDKDGSKYLWV